MFLERLIVQDFRNIELQELEFSPNVNCITGGNGEGKTNLLDAIYYLSMTKSAFGTSDRYNFRHTKDRFCIAGTCQMQSGLKSVFSVCVKNGEEKKLRRDDKQYSKISDHIGSIPVVMVSPSDSALVSESADQRRRFVNSVLSQMNREYLNAMQQYNRLLSRRNCLLRDANADEMLLSAFDVQMSSCAEVICRCRREFAEELEPVVAQYYSKVSSGAERVGISYRSDSDKGPLDEVLRSCRERDAMMKFTTAGPHRDDFIFSMNSDPIRCFGSQGQQKSFLVSLKFAQYELMKKNCGFAPLLLLDDLFDKLDSKRVSNLLQMVSGSDFGQIFLSDTNRKTLTGIVDSLTEDCAYFETSAGTFHRIQP